MGEKRSGAAPQAPVLTPIPAWYRDLPPGSEAQLPACCPHSSTRAERWWHRRQPQCRARSHLLPPPGHGAARHRGCGAGRREEEDEDERGASSSSRGSVASWVGEKHPAGHLQRGWGGLWGWQHPQHPSHFPAPAEGDGMCWEDGCSTATGSTGASTAVPGEQPGPAGVAGMGSGRHAGSIAPRINPLPPPHRRALGVSQTCSRRCTRHSPQQGQVALGDHPLDGEPPTCTSGPACTPTLPGHSPSLRPLGPEVKLGEAPAAAQDPRVLWGMAQP